MSGIGASLTETPRKWREYFENGGNILERKGTCWSWREQWWQHLEKDCKMSKMTGASNSFICLNSFTNLLVFLKKFNGKFSCQNIEL